MKFQIKAHSQKIVSVLLAVSMTACAASRNSMINEGSTLSDTTVCRNFLLDQEKLNLTSSPAPQVTRELNQSGKNTFSNSQSTSDEPSSNSSTDQPDNEEANYAHALSRQVERRRLTPRGCESVVKDADTKIVIGIVGAIAVGAAAVAASNSSSSGYSSGYSPSYSNNYGYAWDQFYGPNSHLQWRCRDRSNGQFAANSNCAGQAKLDSTWPAK